MGEHIVKIRSVANLTHDVLRFVADKPPHYDFKPGQATDVSINRAGWIEKTRAFTFTSLPSQHYLEFMVKTYPSHKGVTNELLKLTAGDELIVRDVFGTISYMGPGLFIAGGAGVTPFVSILRHLRTTGAEAANTLICANKTRKDILLEDEFREMFGERFINVLSAEEREGYEKGYVNEDLLRSVTRTDPKYVYVCGPPPMMRAVELLLLRLKVDRRAIVKEEF